jgi:hypothetical protein
MAGCMCTPACLLQLLWVCQQWMDLRLLSVISQLGLAGHCTAVFMKAMLLTARVPSAAQNTMMSEETLKGTISWHRVLATVCVDTCQDCRVQSALTLDVRQGWRTATTESAAAGVLAATSAALKSAMTALARVLFTVWSSSVVATSAQVTPSRAQVVCSQQHSR